MATMDINRQRTANGWKISLVRAGLPVSWCSIVERTMRFGTARLNVGGIGGVGTLDEFRKRGYARRVLEDAVSTMAQSGYDLSFLHGIQDFYCKFGFVTCMAEYESWLETREAERTRGPLRTRRLRRSDLPQVIDIANRDADQRTGSAVRRAGQWHGFTVGTWWTVPARAQVVIDRQGAIAGYVVVDDTPAACRVSEVGGGGEGVYPTMIEYLWRRAVRLRRENIWVHLPEDHSFSVYCRRFGLRSHTLYPRAQKGMGRIIDLHSCMRQLCSELANRWRRSGAPQAVLGLRTEIGTGRLRMDGDMLVWEEGPSGEGICLTQQDLTQLIFGYVRPSDLENWGRICVPTAQRELAEGLFPLQQAHLSWADRF